MAKKKTDETSVLPVEQPVPESTQPQPEADIPAGPAEELAAEVVEPIQLAEPAPAAEPASPKAWVRFLRGLLRTVALVVGAFALGLLAGYVLLYQPSRQGLLASQQEMQSVVKTLADTKSQLDSSRSDLLVTQSHLQEVEAALTRSDTYGLVMKVQNDVTRARLAVINKNGAEALSALKIARRNLDLLLPKVRNLEGKLADLLDEQMKSTEQSLVSDYLKADPDLQKLNDSLETLETLLVK
jgi:hypothetical protein